MDRNTDGFGNRKSAIENLKLKDSPMAVAEKPLVETAPRNPQHELVRSSVLAAVLVLACLWVVLAGLPLLWDLLAVEDKVNVFLSSVLLLSVTAGIVVGIVFLGRRLEQTSSPPAGTRAGAFFVVVTLYLILWLTGVFDSAFKDLEAMGLVLTLAITGVLLYFAARVFLRPGFGRWLIHVEEQGWFHATSYKATQGVRVRRGTIIALLALGICGIYTLWHSRALGGERLGANNWEWTLPFSGNALYVPLMFKIHYTVLIVLAVLSGWFAWRVVNWPVFADFLIATEAEMNKVSWTTRRRLYQDTIVVLVTVILLTMYLFFVDILWIKVLSSRFVNVLQVDLKAEQQKQQEKTQW
jgi:preprotein translocase SecE subunit